jgi:hypothetical protein
VVAAKFQADQAVQRPRCLHGPDGTGEGFGAVLVGTQDASLMLTSA